MIIGLLWEDVLDLLFELKEIENSLIGNFVLIT